MTDKTTDGEKSYERFWLAGVIIAAVVMVFKQKTGQEVLYLNSWTPFLVYAAGSVLGYALIFLIRRWLFGLDRKPGGFFSNFANNAKNIFFAIMVFGTLGSFGFYYFNLSYARNKKPGYEHCRVWRINLGRAGSTNTVDFYFHGKDRDLNNFLSNDDFRLAYKEKKYDSYFMNITYEEGLFSSFIVEDWEFEIK